MVTMMSLAFAAPCVAPLYSANINSANRSPLTCRVRVSVSPRMTISDAPAAAGSTIPLQKTEPKLPTKAPNALLLFANFFAAMNGSWNSERTYHYVQQRRRESSQTTFDVTRLAGAQIDEVLSSNGEVALLDPQDRTYSEGLNVSFLTRMESQAGLVRASTNLAFVPRHVAENTVSGDYFRDLGYEESSPIAAKFSFDAKSMALSMTTYYTKVVSVDEISLVNPSIRLRKIVNYKRPAIEGAPLVEPLLVGFGVESKGDEDRLVERFA